MMMAVETFRIVASRPRIGGNHMIFMQGHDDWPVPVLRTRGSRAGMCDVVLRVGPMLSLLHRSDDVFTDTLLM